MEFESKFLSERLILILIETFEDFGAFPFILLIKLIDGRREG